MSWLKQTNRVMTSVHTFRIIQSIRLGSRSPIYQNEGWQTRNDLLVSFSLSCLLLSKYYKDIHVYTDPAGKQFLATQQELPISQIHLLPEHLPLILDKYYCLSMQDKPCLYVENDVFINQAFQLSQQENTLIILEMDTNNSVAYIQGEAYRKNHIQGPSATNYDLNSSVIGSSHPYIFTEYIEQICAYIKRNPIENHSKTQLKYLIHSMFLGAYAKEKELKITPLFTLPVCIQYPFKLSGLFEKKPYVRIPDSLKKFNETTSATREVLQSTHPGVAKKLKAIQPVDPLAPQDSYTMTQSVIEVLFPHITNKKSIHEAYIQDILKNCEDEIARKLLIDVFSFEQSKKQFYEKVLNVKNKFSSKLPALKHIDRDSLPNTVVQLSVDAEILESEWDWTLKNSLPQYRALQVWNNMRVDPQIVWTLCFRNLGLGRLQEAILTTEDIILFNAISDKPKTVHNVLAEAAAYLGQDIQEKNLRETLNNRLLTKLVYWNEVSVILPLPQ